MTDSLRPDFNDAATLDRWEKLESAARRGEMAVLRKLTKDDPLLKASKHYGWTLLYYAARGGQMDAVRFLLGLGATLDASDRDTLHSVLGNKNDDLAMLLLESGAARVQPGAPDVNLLANAAEEGCIKTVRWMLEAGVDPNASENYTDVPLCKAALYERTAIVELLLSHNADPNKASSTSRTAMHYAASYGKTDIVSMLHKKGGQVNVVALGGETPLSGAADKGNTATVKLLLELGANPDGAGGDKSPVVLAAKEKHEAVVALLLAKGADPNGAPDRHQTKIPLIEAADAGSDRIVNLLLDAGAGINMAAQNLRQSALVSAAYSSSISAKTLSRMLEMGAEVDAVDYHGRTALLRACESKQKDKADALIAAGANINAIDGNDHTPLYYAVKNNDIQLAKAFLARGADVNVPINHWGDTVLHAACEDGHLDMVRLLLSYKANINAVDRLYRRTALGVAVQSVKNKDIVKELIAAGADLEVRDHTGRTPLVMAVDVSNPEAATMLVDAGASIFGVTDAGESLLTIAAGKKDKNTVHRLLKAGLSPDTADKNGRFPLIAAVKNGDTDMMRLLIDAGATLDLQDGDGRSALIVASLCSDADVLRILLEAGADLHLQDKAGRSADYYIRHYSSHKPVIELFSREVERRQAVEEKNADPAERIRARIEELEKRWSQGDDGARAVVSGDPESLRAVKDDQFWRAECRRPSWELALFALLTENRPMLRLLSAWGAECDPEHLEELRLLAGKKYPDYARILRQTGFPLKAADLAIKEEATMSLVYSKEEAAKTGARVALVREPDGVSRTVLYTSIVAADDFASGVVWTGKKSAFRDLCRHATVDDLKNSVANDAKPPQKPRAAGLSRPKP